MPKSSSWLAATVAMRSAVKNVSPEARNAHSYSCAISRGDMPFVSDLNQEEVYLPVFGSIERSEMCSGCCHHSTLIGFQSMVFASASVYVRWKTFPTPQ